MSEVTWLPRRAMPTDPIEGLRELVTEYGAASNAERNYGSCRFAHLFWSYLTDLAPLLEQRHADAAAAREAFVRRIMAEAEGLPPPRPALRAVK